MDGREDFGWSGDEFLIGDCQEDWLEQDAVLEADDLQEWRNPEENEDYFDCDFEE